MELVGLVGLVGSRGLEVESEKEWSGRSLRPEVRVCGVMFWLIDSTEDCLTFRTAGRFDLCHAALGWDRLTALPGCRMISSFLRLFSISLSATSSSLLLV